MHVLVVDDVSVTREVLRAVACSAIEDAVVSAASTLEDALTIARGTPRLEVVLLDLGLPGCTGIDALVRFRSAFPALKVIVVSADDTADVAAEAMQAGAIAFVPKSGLRAGVLAAIRQGGMTGPLEQATASPAIPSTLMQP
jgi:DNA-binding NarL/FixJ family response regulator